jgi:transposase InsO family protein
MHVHGNATLGPAGRRRLVEAVESGMSQKRAAARFCVSPQTVNRWVRRAREASAEERSSGACFEDRSSRPHTSPGLLSVVEQDRICGVRQRTGWGPRLIAAVVGRPHSTVHATLRRRGLSRRPRPARDEVCRHEWPCPGDLLHMDTKRYARFEQPGHAVTGDRSERNRPVGWEWAHSIVDDHSRLAYSEVLDDERGDTVVGFLERALRFYAAHGIKPKRLMTDNAFAYTKSNQLKRLLRERRIKHLTTDPYRPQTNGKVERFQQTMAREWGYGLAYPSSTHRRGALPHWLAHYNQRRPHSGIGDRPPTSRVHNHPGQNS